jgi:membrane-associated phospholipid phosphatase
LDAADRALGFDWYRLMLAMADHPILNGWLLCIYNLALPEIALLLVVLAWTGKADKVYRFCLAIALAALVTIGLWALHPSFGAMSLYTLPPDVAHRLVLALTCEFGKAQVALLRDGPGYITPDMLHGSLIGFPSYHGALAMIVAYYSWQVRALRWPLLVLNALVLISTPVQGGHHLVDVLAAFPVTALALFLAGEWKKAKNSAKSSEVVNKLSRWSMKPRALPQFPFMPAKD